MTDQNYEQFIKDNAAEHPDEETNHYIFFCKKCRGTVVVEKKFIKDYPQFWGQYDYVATCQSCGDVQTGRYPEDKYPREEDGQWLMNKPKVSTDA